MSKFYKDAIERVCWTAAQAFVGALVITGGRKALESAGIAAAAAALSAIKAIAAKRIGDHDSASTVPSI